MICTCFDISDLSCSSLRILWAPWAQGPGPRPTVRWTDRKDRMDRMDRTDRKDQTDRRDRTDRTDRIRQIGQIARMDRRTERQRTDGRTDGRTGGRTDGQTATWEILLHLLATLHAPRKFTLGTHVKWN
jgi:hypothetical protein